MSKKVTYESFDLLKISVADKKVVISYYDLEDPNLEQNPKGKNLPHPKLIDALQDLAEIFADSSGHLKGWDPYREHVRLNDLDKFAEVTKLRNEEIDNHTVTGISFIGDSMKGIQISGSFRTLLGVTGYTAPKVYFENDKISYGATSEQLAEKVKERVYGYLFKGEIGTQKSKSKTDEETEDPAQIKMFTPPENVEGVDNQPPSTDVGAGDTSGEPLEAKPIVKGSKKPKK